MKKIKGQGTLTKFITSKIAVINKRSFTKITHSLSDLKRIALLINNDRPIDLQVVGFSSLRDYPEQILSILSFVRYVGRPTSWTIYSDGSHTDKEIETIKSVFPFVTIIKNHINDLVNIKPALQPFKQELMHFTENHVLGKKLFFYLNHKIDNPTLFLDSDVLFYEKASILHPILHQNVAGWYLPDAVWGCLDSRYTSETAQQLDQVNAGFVIMNAELPNLSDGLNFLKRINFTYEYFSEQTVMHIISKTNNFTSFDPKSFIVNSDDQFDFSYLYSRENIAVRHYTSPVRHKIWQRDWRWHLSL